jgi:anti-sigma factor RsiW
MNCEELRGLHDLYLDGELAAPEFAEVEAHLRLCPGCRAVIDTARALTRAIQRKVQRHAAPPLVTARLRRALGHTPRHRLQALRYLGVGWNPLAIAASLLLTIATSAGVTAAYVSPAPEQAVVQQLVASHVRSMMGDHLTDVASSDQHIVRPFFAGKVDAAPPAVDLAKAGFPLLGGRLDYVADHRCAALVYRHDTHIINVMVWPREASDEETTEAYARQGYNLVHVTEGSLDYWAVSDLDRGKLDEFMSDLMSAARAGNTQT